MNQYDSTTGKGTSSLDPNHEEDEAGGALL